MKKLMIATLILASAPVLADVHATAKAAKGGGKYVLLTSQCETGGQEAYVYLDNGVTEDGCWTADEHAVTVVWEETGKRRYPRSHFKLQKEEVEIERVVRDTVSRVRNW